MGNAGGCKAVSAGVWHSGRLYVRIFKLFQFIALAAPALSQPEALARRGDGSRGVRAPRHAFQRL